MNDADGNNILITIRQDYFYIFGHEIFAKMIFVALLILPSISFAASYNINNFQTSRFCDIRDKLDIFQENNRLVDGPFVIEKGETTNSDRLQCKKDIWSSKECKLGVWIDGQNVSLSPGQYVHDIRQKELQFTNQQNWEIKSIFIEYSYERGDSIVYELSIEGLDIQPNERALLTRLPQKSYYIRSMTLFGSPKQKCSTHFTDAEILERERAQSEKERLTAEKNRQAASVKKQKSSDTETVPTAKIYTNCIADKLPPNASEDFTVAVKSICLRASQNPTFWNRLFYDYLGQ